MPSFLDDYTDEVYAAIPALIRLGLIDDQAFLHRKVVGNAADGTQRIVLEADYWSESETSILSSVSYAELHALMSDNRFYDARFLDGGLIQFRFEFLSSRKNRLVRSRLAYLPSPDLLPFQTDPDIYLNDELFGDVVDIRAVTTPIRFDFDSRPGVAEDLLHPVSHVTFGQYPYCRIAAVSAISPLLFVDLVLRSFYRTEHGLPSESLPVSKLKDRPSITGKEASLVHFAFPTS